MADRPNGYSMPLISKARRSYAASPLKNSDQKNPEEQNAWSKLPTLKISKILQKIGAGDRRRQMFIPNEQDQVQFKKKKWEELSRQYSPRRYVEKEPFNGQLDDIVLGCYDYGQNSGRRTVWKKYRQKCDDLTFDTLRVMKK